MSAVVSPVPVEASPASAPAPAAAAQKSHLYWIDWLRFLAAAMVLLDHLCDTNWLGNSVPPDPRYKTLLALLVVPIHLGRQAVVVFFVLSGALVGGLTLRKIRAGTFDAASYATDRAARIYLPLVPALLLTAASVRVLDDPLLPIPYLGCLFGLQEVVTHHPYANGALWSLSYEMWFYVLAGCAAVLTAWRSRPSRVRVAALSIGVLALGILCFRLEWTYLVCWLLGAAGMELSERINPPARLRVTIAGLTVMLVGVVAFIPEVVAMIPPLAPLSRWSGLARVANVTLAAGTLLLIAGVCRWTPSNRAGAWIERLGTPLAAFSYTLYLTHMPILRVFASTSMQLPRIVTWYSLFRATCWAAVCIVAALIMYRLFEAQTPRVRQWLRTRRAGGFTRAARVPGQPPLAAEA